MMLLTRIMANLNYHSEDRHMPNLATKTIDTFDSPQQRNNYTIHINIPEFTCLCPKTGQPDFATIKIAYVPNTSCIELKSLKLYIWSYRNEGAFHEAVTNQILADLTQACQPHFMRVSAIFNIRGGIETTVVAEHKADNWQAPEQVVLP